MTNHLPVTAGLCDRGRLRLGVLATLVDVGGAGVAVHAALPDWIATADLQCHLLRPVSEGSVEIECRPLRIGTRRIVVDATVRDDDGHLCATGRMAFARVPGTATTASAADVTEEGPMGFSIDGGTPIEESVVDRCGMEIVAPGRLRFDKTSYVENSIGTVNGGVLAIAADAAAVAATPHQRASDLHIHYLEQIADGPVTVEATVQRTDTGSTLCAVSVTDDATDRLVATASVTLTD